MSVLKSIRIKDETFQQIKKMSIREKRTVSNFINKILDDFVCGKVGDYE